MEQKSVDIPDEVKDLARGLGVPLEQLWADISPVLEQNPSYEKDHSAEVKRDSFCFTIRQTLNWARAPRDEPIEDKRAAQIALQTVVNSSNFGGTQPLVKFWKKYLTE